MKAFNLKTLAVAMGLLVIGSISHILVGLLATVSLSAFASSQDRSVIHHPTCKLIVKEAINYRGMGEYTMLKGPLKNYAQSLKESLISDLGYVGSESTDGAIIITLSTSYADFYVHNNEGSSMRMKTSFCYVNAQSTEFSDIGYYQETRDCKKSLKAVIKQMPKCEVIKN